MNVVPFECSFCGEKVSGPAYGATCESCKKFYCLQHMAVLKIEKRLCVICSKAVVPEKKPGESKQ